MTTESPMLIFKPKKRAAFTKSPFYAFVMWGRSFVTAMRFLAKAVSDHNSVAAADYAIDNFWRVHFEESFTTLYATGRENIVRGETYVYMSNHGSWMDIPAMFGAVPSSLRMISKAGLMKVPLLGAAMEKAGFIAIDRKNRARAIKQLEAAKIHLRQGISIWMAPEGTRSRDGSLMPFKKGGFHVARELGLPILPVYIQGAIEVMPADSMMVYPNRSITVHFCAPVNTADFDRAHTDQLLERVRQSIINKQQECERNS